MENLAHQADAGFVVEWEIPQDVVPEAKAFLKEVERKVVHGIEASVLEAEKRVFGCHIPVFEDLMKAGCEEQIIMKCVNNPSNLAFPRAVAAMGKALDVLTAMGQAPSEAFAAVERVHERVRTYLGVCTVSSVLFVTTQGMTPDVAKLRRQMAKKKLSPPKKKPIVVDDFLLRLLDA